MIAGKSAVGIIGKEPKWFWKPFIPAGRVTLIQGNTGIGKTSLMLRIVADSTNGLKPPTQFHGELLAQEKGEPITVFYITTENGIEDTLIPMFDLYGGKREYLYFQDEDEGHFVLNEEDIRATIERFDAKLIVIDPWQEFLDDIASTSNEKLRSMLLRIQKVAEETGTTIVLCGNFSKSRSGSDLAKGLGGSEMMITLRSILTVTEDPYKNNLIRMLKTSKMSFKEKETLPVGLKQESDYTLSYFPWRDYEASQENKTLSEMKENSPKEQEEKISPNEGNDTDREIRKAVAFLKDILQDGPMDSLVLYEQAMEAGISKSTLYRAKRGAGVHSKRQKDRTSLWKFGTWD
jgi:RecA-family ATPase